MPLELDGVLDHVGEGNLQLAGDPGHDGLAVVHDDVREGDVALRRLGGRRGHQRGRQSEESGQGEDQNSAAQGNLNR